MLFLLLGTSSNLKANLHFCGDVLTQFGFGEHETEPCDCADMSSMDCCEDVVFKTQNSNPALISEIQIKHFASELAYFAIPTSFNLNQIPFPSPFSQIKHQFLRKRISPDCALLAVFRI